MKTPTVLYAVIVRDVDGEIINGTTTAQVEQQKAEVFARQLLAMLERRGAATVDLHIFYLELGYANQPVATVSLDDPDQEL